MNEWGRVQSIGQNIERWRDMTVRNFLVHPERKGPLLKRLGTGWELPRRLRLYVSYIEYAVSDQTDISGRPGRTGTWLEKPDPAERGGRGG